MVSRPSVLVVEFITGGGWPPGPLPSGLTAEGRAMLKAVLADFRAWGDVRTVTLRDLRQRTAILPADAVVDVEPGCLEAVLKDRLPTCDAALVIAPETDGILTRLSALVEGFGVPLLGSASKAVAVATDKWACHRRFAEAGLPVPDTWLIPREDWPQVVRALEPPLVIKPLDGVGCEGVVLVRQEADLAEARALLDGATRHPWVLAQRFVEGVAASVSLLVTDGGRARALSLNGQAVRPGQPFAYRGGVVPLEHPLRDRAFAVARAAVGLIPGLRGYVGVDLVLTEDEAWLMEVNPRLTTSYVGLRRVVTDNLARALWEAARSDRLPGDLRFTGRAVFRKTARGLRCRVSRG